MRLNIINSPSTPSGRVIDPREFRRIMEVLAEKGRLDPLDGDMVAVAPGIGEPLRHHPPLRQASRLDQRG